MTAGVDAGGGWPAERMPDPRGPEHGTPVGHPPRAGPTLSRKGVIATLLIAAYVTFASAVFIAQQQRLVGELDEADRLYRLADRTLLLAASPALAADAPPADAGTRAPQVALPAEPAVRAPPAALADVRALATALRAWPALEPVAAGLDAAAASEPGPAPAALRLRLADAAPRIAGAAAAAHDAALDFGRTSVATVVATGVLGIVLFGAIVMLFFARISVDLRLLRDRAVDLLLARDRAPVPVTRPDEIGELAAIVNRLAVLLEARERDLELERRKGFHSEKMVAVGALAAGVLTEIGNPIAAIDGFARELASRARDAGEGTPDRAMIDAILEQTARLTAIAHEIERIASPAPCERELLDVNDMVARAIRLLRFDPRTQALVVDTDLDRQLPAVPGVADRLVQLVMNLVGNAADALAERPGHAGRIRIATRRTPRAAVLEVADDGAGMSDAVLARAFEPFFSTKPPGRGTGLGLTLCRSIVDEHGGRIQVDSAPGRGTLVTVTLPFDANVALDSDKAGEAHDVPASAGHRR